jgi:uncharacterized membrane protein
MSVDTEKPKTKNTQIKNTWIIALLVSIAVNGLLGGILLSKQAQHGSTDLRKSTMQSSPGGLEQTSSNDPKHLVRALSPERRKMVMVTAMKNLTESGKEHPRRLFKRLRQAKHKTMQLLRADELDTAAIEQSLADIRDLNKKLAVSGDALMIEILAQLTPEERRAAREAVRNHNPQTRRRKMKRH